MSNTVKGLGLEKGFRVYGKANKGSDVSASVATPPWVMREQAAAPPIDPSPMSEPSSVKAEETKVEPVMVEETPPAPRVFLLGMDPVDPEGEPAPETTPPVAEKVKGKKTKAAPKVTPKAEKRRPTILPVEYRYTSGLWSNLSNTVSAEAQKFYADIFEDWSISWIGQEVILTFLTSMNDPKKTQQLLQQALQIYGPFEDTRPKWEAVTPQAWVDLLCKPPTYLKKCLPHKKAGLGHGKGRGLMCDLLRHDGFNVSC